MIVVPLLFFVPILPQPPTSTKNQKGNGLGIVCKLKLLEEGCVTPPLPLSCGCLLSIRPPILIHSLTFPPFLSHTGGRALFFYFCSFLQLDSPFTSTHTCLAPPRRPPQPPAQHHQQQRLPPPLLLLRRRHGGNNDTSKLLPCGAVPAGGKELRRKRKMMKVPWEVAVTFMRRRPILSWRQLKPPLPPELMRRKDNGPGPGSG